jgi:hypothetical protein
MHGADRLDVLLDHRLQVAAALAQIPIDAAQDPQIGIGVHEHPDVHQLA